MTGTKDSLWSIYNSVTDYVDHRQATDTPRDFNPSSRLQSVWFGKGSAIKVHAFNMALAFKKT